MAETALQHSLDPGPGSERYQVVVHVDAAALADPAEPGQSALEGAVHVPAEISRRLACDATRVVLRHADDRPPLADGVPELGRRAARPQMGDRRPAPRSPAGDGAGRQPLA